jgi:prolipoprotein diacylglyceryltransferase
MYPRAFELLGTRLTIWDISLLAGIVLGYFVLRYSFRIGEGPGVPSLLPLRWFVTVYVSVVGAKLFAYLFDLNTTLLPPASVGWAGYYLDPLSGPKTLYGAVVLLPLGVFLVSTPWGDLSFGETLDRWTPALMAVLASARIGCLLEGCCYGRRSEWLGIVFPAGTPPAILHHHRGLIPANTDSLPVIPTQAIEAGALIVLVIWCLQRVRRGRPGVFAGGIAFYSVLRFLIELARDDPERNVYGPLSSSQWIALAILGMVAAWRVLAPTFAFRRSSAATMSR